MGLARSEVQVEELAREVRRRRRGRLPSAEDWQDLGAALYVDWGNPEAPISEPEAIVRRIRDLSVPPEGRYLSATLLHALEAASEGDHVAYRSGVDELRPALAAFLAGRDWGDAWAWPALEFAANLRGARAYLRGQTIEPLVLDPERARGWAIVLLAGAALCADASEAAEIVPGTDSGEAHGGSACWMALEGSASDG